jgi:hypothetical protein
MISHHQAKKYDCPRWWLILLKWWAQQDLNLRPADYESACSTIEIERRQHIPAVHHNPATLLIWR